MKATVNMNSKVQPRFELLGLIFILAMVTVATFLNDSELILPEIGALTAGTWLYRKPAWTRQPLQLFFVPSGTAVIGFLINRTALSYPLKVLIGLGLMLIFMKVMRSNLAPAFATGLLPIIINATHWAFIAAIFFWTLSLMVGVYAQRLPRSSQRETGIHPLQMLGFVGLILLWVGVVWLTRHPQMAAIPPVIVVLFEAIQNPHYAYRMAGKHWLALTGAASIGVATNLLVHSWLLTALIALPIVWLGLRLLKLQLPAAYAFPLLAIVLPIGMKVTLPLAAALSAGLFFSTLVVFRYVQARRMVTRSEQEDED